MLRTILMSLATAAVASPFIVSPLTTASATGGSASQEVLLRARFDRLDTGSLSPSEFRTTLRYQPGTAALDDSAIVRRGVGKSYRLKFDARTYKGSAGNNGMNIFVPLRKEVTYACLRYQVRFDANFDWDKGGKLPGLGGVRPGISPGTPTGGGNPGDKGWSGRLMWLTPESYRSASSGNMAVSYMYSPRQTSKWGDNLKWNRAFKRGTWHTVKQCYKMNTVGKANGVLTAWLDGVMVLDIRNYVYRLRSDVKISHLYWVSFRGGAESSWAGDRDSRVNFDNVSVVAKYAG